MTGGPVIALSGGVGAAMARLYSRIPVIAAYEEDGADMMQWAGTLRRPWIHHEIRAYSQNPTRVTHVDIFLLDSKR